jgi:hypothetical protein
MKHHVRKVAGPAGGGRSKPSTSAEKMSAQTKFARSRPGNCSEFRQSGSILSFSWPVAMLTAVQRSHSLLKGVSAMNEPSKTPVFDNEISDEALDAVVGGKGSSNQHSSSSSSSFDHHSSGDSSSSSSHSSSNYSSSSDHSSSSSHSSYSSSSHSSSSSSDYSSSSSHSSSSSSDYSSSSSHSSSSHHG